MATRTKGAEPVLFRNANGHQVQFRVVRDIREWNGRLVGICRNSLGAEFVVQRNVVGRWDVLDGVSSSDIREAV